MAEQRRLVVMVHPTRVEAHEMAARFVESVAGEQISCYVPADQAATLRPWLDEDQLHVLDDHPEVEPDIELAVVFGGDGSILRAAEWALPREIALLGVNLGHVGFLAELDPSQIGTLVDHVVHRTYEVEERLALKVSVADAAGEQFWESFAVNEVSVEKAARERMLEILATIDSRPISQWGCDGVLVATPTGSTAYAFSAGGPVMWPDVESIIVVPLSAHALFARPMVIAPQAVVQLEVVPDLPSPAVMWCDGRRTVDLEPGSVITVTRDPRPLRLARLSEQPFADRLVRKFGLRVRGWRGPGEAGKEHSRASAPTWHEYAVGSEMDPEHG